MTNTAEFVRHGEVVQALRDLTAAAVHFDQVERGAYGWNESTFQAARADFLHAVQHAQSILARIDQE